MGGSSSAERVDVEVAYALPQEQVILKLRVVAGTTLREAIEKSGICGRFPQIDLATCSIGVYGKLREPGDTVAPGDRIEIYRALSADPKDVRRRRAAQDSARKARLKASAKSA
jgi:hypothetical protein